MKYCKFCGEQIESEAVLCVKCGRQLEDLTVSTPPTTQNLGTPDGYCNKWLSLCLLILLGPFGAHKFYEKKPTAGIIYIVGWVFAYILAQIGLGTGSIGILLFVALIILSLGVALLVDLISILGKPAYYPSNKVIQTNPFNTNEKFAVNSDGMTMIKVKGSTDFIESAGYKELTRELYVKFASGNITLFIAVPEHVFKGLIDTLSPKSYYNENINGIYSSIMI